jgi:hypothetical protein
LLAVGGAAMTPAAARADTTYLRCDNQPPGGFVHRIQLIFTTGGDDLRGNSWQGDDNLDVTIVPRYHRPLFVPDVNQGRNWPNNSVNTVNICVAGDEVFADELTGIRLATTTGGFNEFDDNWNLDAIQINYQDWYQDRRDGNWMWKTRLHVAHSGDPLYRFTASGPVYDVHADGVFDGGFEAQTRRTVSSPWRTEGPDPKGIDIGLHQEANGANNGFTWATGRHWDALVQNVPVTPWTNYVLTGKVRTSARVNTGFFGARLAGVWPPPGEWHFGYTGHRYQQLTVYFNSTNHTWATVYCGLWATGTPGGDWIQMDDISLRPAPSGNQMPSSYP